MNLKEANDQFDQAVDQLVTAKAERNAAEVDAQKALEAFQAADAKLAEAFAKAQAAAETFKSVIDALVTQPPAEPAAQ